jgi:hypothetical protein
MITTNNFTREAEEARNLFLRASGLSRIEISVEPSGPETFLKFHVGRKAPFYLETLYQVNQALVDDHPFRGSLLLKVAPTQPFFDSPEAELLRILISRSLVVNRQTANTLRHVEFAPFRHGEDALAIQPANHLIVGRRGVGKSTLILNAINRLKKQNDLPIWLELRRYHGRADTAAIAEVLSDFVRELIRFDLADDIRLALNANVDKLSAYAQQFSTDVDSLKSLIPHLTRTLEYLTKKQNQSIFLFLDDFHLIAPSLQPELLDIIYSTTQGTGTWLKIAFVKHLGRYYDRTRKLGLQVPNDAQLIPLDLTLTDPPKTKKHLVAILGLFLRIVGITRQAEIIPEQAIDRLVWCSAGVARDFLALFNTALSYAQEHGHKAIGVQDVNLAVGDAAQLKLSELEEETSTEEIQYIRSALNELQKVCLDDNQKNAFLVPYLPDKSGYQILQKLVDLRLVHLIHPSITPSRAGERYEAYLLDHSFYTGMRRRKGIQEVQIKGDRPKYAELRKLPRVDLDTFSVSKSNAKLARSKHLTDVTTMDAVLG